MRGRLPAIVRAYSVGALLILACAAVLDASFLAHFQTRYAYGASVDVRDLAVILQGFTPADLQFTPWSLLLILALAAATVLANWWSSHIGPWSRLFLSALQLPVVLIGGVGAMVFASTVTSGVRAGLDGEWLHNGTPLLGALGIWAIVPAMVMTAALNEILDASRHRSAA